MILIIITGLPGAGKGILADAFRDLKTPVIVMGDVVRSEVVRRGMTPNPVNTKQVMLELREKNGPGAIAHCCIEKLEKMSSPVVVIEGCRSLDEIKVFKEYSQKITIIGVHASPFIRYTRLKQRARSDAPTSWDEFCERDMRELSLGLGDVIALSDIMIVNESSIEDMQRTSTDVAKRCIDDKSHRPLSNIPD